MALPVVEVSHLASSTSFYAAILQSLGLRFLDSTPDRASVTFGANGNSMLQVRLMAAPRPSYLLFGAPSAAAVADFRAAAMRANPATIPDRNTNTVTRAVIQDLDGNTVEVVYGDAGFEGSSSYEYSRSTVTINRTTRILQWNYKSSSSSSLNYSSNANYNAPSVTYNAPAANYNTAGPNYASSSYNNSSTQRTSVQRDVSHGSSRPYVPAPPETPESTLSQESKSSTLLNATTVVGTLLGVAAGAAFTYKMYTSKDRDQSPGQDARPSAAPRRDPVPQQAAPQMSRDIPRGDDRLEMPSRPAAQRHESSNKRPEERRESRDWEQRTREEPPARTRVEENVPESLVQDRDSHVESREKRSRDTEKTAVESTAPVISPQREQLLQDILAARRRSAQDDRDDDRDVPRDRSPPDVSKKPVPATERSPPSMPRKPSVDARQPYNVYVPDSLNRTAAMPGTRVGYTTMVEPGGYHPVVISNRAPIQSDHTDEKDRKAASPPRSREGIDEKDRKPASSPRSREDTDEKDRKAAYHPRSGEDPDEKDRNGQDRKTASPPRSHRDRAVKFGRPDKKADDRAVSPGQQVRRPSQDVSRMPTRQQELGGRSSHEDLEDAKLDPAQKHRDHALGVPSEDSRLRDAFPEDCHRAGVRPEDCLRRSSRHGDVDREFSRPEDSRRRHEDDRRKVVDDTDRRREPSTHRDSRDGDSDQKEPRHKESRRSDVRREPSTHRDPRREDSHQKEPRHKESRREGHHHGGARSEISPGDGHRREKPRREATDDRHHGDSHHGDTHHRPDEKGDADRGNLHRELMRRVSTRRGEGPRGETDPKDSRREPTRAERLSHAYRKDPPQAETRRDEAQREGPDRDLDPDCPVHGDHKPGRRKSLKAHDDLRDRPAAHHADNERTAVGKTQRDSEYVEGRRRESDRPAAAATAAPPPPPPPPPPNYTIATGSSRRPSISASPRKPVPPVMVPKPPHLSSAAEDRWDDDSASLAPSDSISCVGSK